MRLKSVSRPLAETFCIVELALALCLVLVGILATLGIGTVRYFHLSLLVGLPPAAVAFLGLCLVRLQQARRGGGTRRVPRLTAPYSWGVAAAAILALVSAALLISTGHTGKSQPCDGGYCRYTAGRLVPISTTKYLEDQGGGAIFGGFWSVAVTTLALGAVRGKLTMRTRGRRYWRPRRS
jgi:hypothetical protein